MSGVVFGVTKRYGEDRAGQLAALVTFYGFLSVFPLLLLLVTIAGLVFRGTSLEHDLVNSALGEFPVIGSQLRQNIHAVTRGSPVAMAVSLVGLAWGSLGVTSVLQNASHRIWRLPTTSEPGWWPRTLKGVQLLGALALIVVLSSAAAGVSTVGAHVVGGVSFLPRALVLSGVLVVNVAGYLLVLWLLAPRAISWRLLVPGATLGAVGWTVLQGLSGYLLGHQLHHASEIYGFFAVVLGLVFWIHLGAQLFLYSSELNVVLARREWPRYVFGEPLDNSSTD